MDEAGGVARAPYERVHESVHWSDELAGRIVARVAGGESVRGLAREAGFPRPETVTRWGRERPEFRAAIEAAREAAGSRLRGSACSYCVETAEEICRRLGEGEGLVRICADAEMPARVTVVRWRRAQPAFEEAYQAARELAADWVFEEGWRMMAEATVETAYLVKVRLGHLRWHAGKILPKRYGALKAVEAEAVAAAAAASAAQAATTVVMRSFRIDPVTWTSREDEETPDEVLYSVDAAGVVTKPPSEELARRAAKKADHGKAAGEAGLASLAAGEAVNGYAALRFWPEWWKARYPREWLDMVNMQWAEEWRQARWRVDHGALPADLTEAGPAEEPGAFEADW